MSHGAIIVVNTTPSKVSQHSLDVDKGLFSARAPVPRSARCRAPCPLLCGCSVRDQLIQLSSSETATAMRNHCFTFGFILQRFVWSRRN